MRPDVIGNRRVEQESGDVGVTSTETRDSWSDRLSPRNWPLVWKLVAVGLVPALLAIVLGVLRVADQAQSASELGSANRLLEVRGEVADAATALRTERDRAVVFVAERRLGNRGSLTDAIGGSDRAIEDARSGIAAANGLDAATRSAVEQADGGFAQLSVLRADVTGSAPLLAAQVVQRYTAVIARADVLDRALLRQVRTPGVAGLSDALTAATAASEALALQHTVLGAALRTGAVTPEDRAAVGVTDNAFVSALTEYQVSLPPSQTPLNFVTAPANAQRDAVKTAILNAPVPGPIPVTPQVWDDAVEQANGVVTQAGTEVRTALAAAGATAEDRSSNLAGVNSVILMLGLLLAATIVVLVVRALTRSLRVLRTSALDVAQRRLPQAVEAMRSGGAPDVNVEPVPLHTRDEVGQVARAFDTVHGQALRLAADQAALQSNVSSMFVNLSRRSQALVERQLQLIEQLESNEQDPDQLSNLFQLDHLATRMRRNSENLLVLAGTDLAKRNVAPVPLVDVQRAAVSEIEQYQRIVVQAPPQATVVGRATSDVIHLLAELLDNATNFSPPDSQVVMSSLRAQDGSIVVEIADSGVGMADHELADANRRLGTPSAVDVSASRRMGLFVVGRLGARHGITVHLGGAPMGGPGGGLTASVTLPAHLVMVSGDVEPGPMRRSSPVGAAQFTPNGVPPQRASLPNRPMPHATLAMPADGRPVERPTGLNGLPTRTPGSALNRNVAPKQEAATDGPDAADPMTTEQPVTADSPVGADAPTNDSTRPRADDDAVAATEARADTADGAFDDAHDADAVPTEAVPITPAADGRDAAPEIDGRTDADDRTEAPPSSTGHLTDLQRARAEAFTRRTPADTAVGAPADEDSADASRVDDAAAPAEVEPEADEPAQTAAGSPTASSAEHPAADEETEPADGRSDEAEAGEVAARAGDESADAAADEPAAPRADDGAAAGRAVRPRPTPRPVPAPGPNGTYRDLTVPGTPFETHRDGAGQNGVSNGTLPTTPANVPAASSQTGPHTTPLPVVAESDSAPAGPVRSDEEFGNAPYDGSAQYDGSARYDQDPRYDGADEQYDGLDGAPAAADASGGGLFAASVPSISEPEGLPRSRRPLSEMRRGPVDVTETTPIFAEIASAWFASDRPMPVDWELGERPGDDLVPANAPVPAGRPGLLDGPEFAMPAPSAEPPGQAFASSADEGWRAASGAAAERPDELTAAGLPKRRPRARLVPGSAGSAVLAAPASPTRSAESVRGRLASYQQGVRQGREIRLRRDPGRPGPQPVSSGENAATSGSGVHDEESR